MGFSCQEKKILQKGTPQRNLAADVIKKRLGPIFEPPYLETAIRSHGFFPRIWSFSKPIFQIMKDMYVIFLLQWIISF